MTVEYIFFHILIVDPWKLLLQIAKILSVPVRDFHRIFSSAQALCEERIKRLFFFKKKNLQWVICNVIFSWKKSFMRSLLCHCIVNTS
jgi:hypothetical protein